TWTHHYSVTQPCHLPAVTGHGAQSRGRRVLRLVYSSIPPPTRVFAVPRGVFQFSEYTARIVDSGLPPTIVILIICSPGCRGKNWSSPGFMRSQIRPVSSLMDRLPGSVTILIGDVTSPSIK